MDFMHGRINNYKINNSKLNNYAINQSRINQYRLNGSGIGGVDSYTKLRLPMDGNNGSAIFTDCSLSPKTVTAYGNAQISTTRSKFGGSSAYFDGDGDYIDCSTSTDLVLGTNDFTVDLWINPSAVDSTYRRIVTSIQAAFTAGSFCIRLSNTNKITFVTFGFTLTSTTTPVTGTWYHVAVVKNSGTVKLYINGTEEASSADTNNYTEGVRYVGGNYNGTSEHYYGYVDELRISKGISRWTSNFTPPLSEYTT